MQLTQAVKLVMGVIYVGTFSQHGIPQTVLGEPKTTSNQVKGLSSWTQRGCLRFRHILKRKQMTVQKVNNLMMKLGNNPKLPLPEKTFQLETLRVFIQELNETETLIEQSLMWLQNVLKGNYPNLSSLKDSSKVRLEALRDATLKEEQEYNAMVKAGKKLKQFNHTHFQGVIDEILTDVAKAADGLEKDLDDHVFDTAVHNPNLARGGNIETVIRLEGKPPSNGSSEVEDNGLIKLVDAQDNQFVLARGKDTTVPHEDEQFIKDVLFLMLLCCLCGWISSLLFLPSMFGYIIAGVILGPSCFNIIKSLVQIETLGEFGAFFILFAVGLEFSPSKLKKVLKIAVVGTTMMTVGMLLCGQLLGAMWNASGSESTFVAACLSLSSTPLVVKFLHPGSVDQADCPSNTEYGTVLLGILVMQDVYLGLLMALLPNMEMSSTSSGTAMAVFYAILLGKLIGALLGMLVLCILASKLLVGPLYRYVLRRGSRELTVLTTIALVFIMILVTDLLKISMELGCFLAGVLISAQGHQLSETIENLTQPIKDFLACIFFASVGFHVFPKFLASEITILTTLTMATVGVKYLISVLVLALLTSRNAGHVKWIVSAGLAQVSEFAFVLGSRARRLGLISREVYLLILSVTTLSLLFAPILWKVTLWQLRIKPSSSRGKQSLVPTATDNVVIETSTGTKNPATQAHRRISATS